MLLGGLVLALPVEGCSGGYPLEPTPCDDWCDATRGECEAWYDPAGCVARCEQNNIDADECRTLFDVALDCFRHRPNAVSEDCFFFLNANPNDCEKAQQALLACVGALHDNQESR